MRPDVASYERYARAVLVRSLESNAKMHQSSLDSIADKLPANGLAFIKSIVAAQDAVDISAAKIVPLPVVDE